MDGALDDRIAERQRTGRPRRGGRSDDRLEERTRARPQLPARDSYRKPTNTTRTPEDAHWVHDRFEGDRFNVPRTTRRIDRYADYEDDEDLIETPARLRADNLHYDLTEKDLRELFTRKGPIKSLELLYDRADRSRGTAYVTYANARDAERAIDAYDGQNAYGQPIKLTMMPNGPSAAGGRRGGGPQPQKSTANGGRSLFDRVDRTGGLRRRSESPRRSSTAKAAPNGVDRYVPGERPLRRYSRSRSPLRNNPRRSVRSEPRAEPRPARGGRGAGGRGGNKGESTTRTARPKVTTNDLDAEMDDYWGNAASANQAADTAIATAAENNVVTQPAAPAAAAPVASVPVVAVAVDEDIDMIE